jgi:hypothetical protein
VNCTALIINHLLEDDSEDDFKDVAYVATPAENKRYRLQMAWELEQAKREKRKKELQRLHDQIRLGNFASVSRKDIREDPTILPWAYWRAKSKLYGWVKRRTGAGHNASVRIGHGDDPPKIVSGRRGGWFTKGGTPIKHPGAYSKVGWSNMDYLTNSEEIEVGADWLYSKLPKTTRIFLRYASLDPDYGPFTVSSDLMDDDDEESKSKHHWAYNADEPVLGESKST